MLQKFFLRFSLLFLFASILSCARPRTVVVIPQETDAVLVNPGMGFTTFYSFNGDEINRNHPECSIAYYRWYWDVMEPEEGKPAFAMLDSLLALAHSKGEKLAFRVMCQNGHEVADKTVTEKLEVPIWFRHSGAAGFPYPDGRGWQPDYDDPLFLARHGALIQRLGERYDGHPDLDHVDIGSIGRWGEWHTEGLDLPMPTQESRRKIIDYYVDSFRKTPVVMNLDESPALAYAISRGTGWRADCLGDLSTGLFYDSTGHPENHMHDRYPRILGNFVAPDTWKHAPVVLETCWNIGQWKENGWGVDSILNQALAWHVSVLNNKSFPIPDEWWPQVEAFQKKMGYRFVLTHLEHPDRVSAGGSLPLKMTWENRGVAPCYLKHPLKFQLKAAEGGGEPYSFDTDIDITGWLPGTSETAAELALPPDLPAGSYEIRLALLDPQSLQPRISLAIEGRDDEGWYGVSRVEVK